MRPLCKAALHTLDKEALKEGEMLHQQFTWTAAWFSAADAFVKSIFTLMKRACLQTKFPAIKPNTLIVITLFCKT